MFFSVQIVLFSFTCFLEFIGRVVEPYPHHFWNLDPHPHQGNKLDPDPHQIKIRILIRIRIKGKCGSGSA